MRLSEEEFQRLISHTPAVHVSEKAFQQAVIRVLKQHGWSYIYHTFDSRRSPSGFPDLIACHDQPGSPLLAIELKAEAGQVTPAQQHWLDALARVEQVRAAVVRPSTLEAFVQSLPR